MLAGLADFVGGLLTIVRRRATRRSVLHATALAAGFIVAAAVLDRIPEAITERNPHGPYYILVGFLAIYLVENLFSTHAHGHSEEDVHDHDHCHDPGHAHDHADSDACEHAHEGEHAHALVSQFQPEECHISPSAATAALVGLLLHTFFDGIAIGAGFLTSRHTGLVMFLAVIFHKLPEGFSASALMLSSGRTSRSAVLSAGLLGVATVLGAVAATVMGSVDAAWAQIFLTLATGSFLYIGCSDMIPATNKGDDRRAVFLVLVGIATFIVSTWALRQVGLGH